MTHDHAHYMRLVMGGCYADIGRYTVEAFLEVTDLRLEIVTGVLAVDCEAVRIEWMKAQKR